MDISSWLLYPMLQTDTTCVMINTLKTEKYCMNITQNKKDLTKTVKVIRIVWCFTIVIAIVFLALGISSLVKAGPFFENESEALLPKSHDYDVFDNVRVCCAYDDQTRSENQQCDDRRKQRESSNYCSRRKRCRQIRAKQRRWQRWRGRIYVLPRLRTKNRKRFRILQALRCKAINFCIAYMFKKALLSAFNFSQIGLGV